MMFLVRSAFWLLILVLLIPTDKDQQNQIYGTAQTAMKDIAGFCDRNPKTCATGQDAFQVLVQKAQYGTQMIMALVEGGTGSQSLGGEPKSLAGVPKSLGGEPKSTAASGNRSVMPVPSAVPLETWGLSDSVLNGSDVKDQGIDGSVLNGSSLDGAQDTLNAEDREANWGGPNV